MRQVGAFSFVRRYKDNVNGIYCLAGVRKLVLSPLTIDSDPDSHSVANTDVIGASPGAVVITGGGFRLRSTRRTRSTHEISREARSTQLNLRAG